VLLGSQLPDRGGGHALPGVSEGEGSEVRGFQGGVSPLGGEREGRSPLAEGATAQVSKTRGSAAPAAGSARGGAYSPLRAITSRYQWAERFQMRRCVA
jgi:hypothetical protein